MPIRPELRPLYPPHWRELSSHVRFERAGGRCQRCRPPPSRPPPLPAGRALVRRTSGDLAGSLFRCVTGWARRSRPIYGTHSSGKGAELVP